MSYRIILNQTAYFGRDTIKLLSEEPRKRGYKKVLLITDPILLKTGTAKKVTDILDVAGFPYEVLPDVTPNPPVENVKAGVETCAGAGVDALLGLGSGSPQDITRVAGIIIINPEFTDVLSLEGMADAKKSALPIIGIPTTAGAASEITINYVIIGVANKRKFVCIDPHDIPTMAIMGPDLVNSMPRASEVPTGLDALTHATEGYITSGVQEFSDAVHLTSIRMIAENLRKPTDGDREAGERMAYANHIAGIGYSNVGLGLVHGMTHSLGGRYGVPYGVADGILLPSVIRYNADFIREEYRAIAHAFGVNDAYIMSLEDVRKATCDKVLVLAMDLDSLTRISEAGVDESGLDALAQDAFNDVCTPGNPCKATLGGIRVLYAALLQGLPQYLTQPSLLAYLRFRVGVLCSRGASQKYWHLMKPCVYSFR